MICPRCRKEVPEGAECPACGIVFSKFKAKAPDGAIPGPAPSPEHVLPIARAFAPERPWVFRPVSDGKLAGLYAQFGRLLDAGLPLTEALRLLASRTQGRLSGALAAVRTRVEAGSSLAEALSCDGVLFPGYLRSLVAAGEKTGGLPAVFANLASALELRLRLRRRLIRACIYPFILFSLSFFLIPISKLFTEGWMGYLRASLLPYVLILAVIAVVLFALPIGLRTLLGASATCRLLRGIPVFGGISRLRATLRFSQHLSTSLGAGLDLYAALELSARSSGDPEVVGRVERAAAEVRGGATLEQALGNTGLFDEEFMLAVAAGEAAGHLQGALEQHARLVQDSYLHRLEVAVQITAVAVLLLVYVYVAWTVIAQYRGLIDQAGVQVDQLLKEAGIGSGNPGGGALPSELKDLLQ